MVAVAAAVPPPSLPPQAAPAVVAAPAAEATAVAKASNKSPRGKSVLDKFPCNEFAPDKK